MRLLYIVILGMLLMRSSAQTIPDPALNETEEGRGFFPDRDLGTESTTTLNQITGAPGPAGMKRNTTRRPKVKKEPNARPMSKAEIYQAMIHKKRYRTLSKLKYALEMTYSLMFNNMPCNYTRYKEKMPEFWKAFKSGSVTLAEQNEFAKYYWDVYVDFDNNEDEKVVIGNCDSKDDEHDGCLVKKHEQRVREMDTCFNGGLMECSNQTETCVCLNLPGLETVRVNPDTGNEDNNGTACFVKTGQQCMITHFGMKPIMLPCVDHFMCSSYSMDCVAPDGDWRKRGTHTQKNTEGVEQEHEQNS